MLYPVGFTEEDFAKPQVGIASTWSMVTPCNMHINTLADAACMGADEAGTLEPQAQDETLACPAPKLAKRNSVTPQNSAPLKSASPSKTTIGK